MEQIAYSAGKNAIPVSELNPLPVAIVSEGGSGGSGGAGGAAAPAVGAANIYHGQITVGLTATLICAARTGVSGVGRVDVTIESFGGNDIYLGYSSGVTTAQGMLLPGIKGASITINTTQAIYGIALVAQVVSYLETY